MSQLNARAIPQITDASLRSRFERDVLPEPNSGCWLWTGPKYVYEYGCFSIGRRSYLAHRFAFALYNGAVASKAHVLHRCDNPACVNPAHLYIGTHQQNMKDRGGRGRSSGGGKKGIECPWAKIDESAVRAIRGDERPGAVAGPDYGISPAQFYRIKKRERWGHVP